jgi:cell fate regulator YaaT (PSP1 superfamily)
MAKIDIKLKSDGEFYQLDPGNHEFKIADQILVETDHGQEVAQVVSGETKAANEGMTKKPVNGEQKPIEFIRKLSDVDREKVEKLSIEAKTYLMECQQKIDKYKLPMQLLDADLSFDEKKLTFYFTAPGRVDFRMLVSELAHTFKKIIRLQQIGSRDEARFLGGVGRCGESICCKKFLKGNLESVTLDMAQCQNLAQMGSNRITGVCGKLMCCLKYELEYYQKIKKQMPALGSEYKTEKGMGLIIGQNILTKKMTVKLSEGGSYVEVDCSKLL